MSYWAKAPMDRKQVVLFCPTLDDSISQDHPVRLYDEILAGCDWSSWESQYVLVAGQPPIPPRIVASAILYGLSQGIRSSRVLERMCKNSLDYIWLVKGHHIDHTTFCKFRTRLEELDEQIERIMAEAAEADAQESRLFCGSSPNKLPSELATLSKRQEKLRKAMAAVEKKQAAEKTNKSAGNKEPRVPVADPDSDVLPNKEGGYAPNYTPVVTAESRNGFIMDAEVTADGDECGQTIKSVDRIEENFKQTPKQLLADTNFSSGENLAELQERKVASYIPVRRNAVRKDNPAERAEPTEPAAEEDWPKLPRKNGPAEYRKYQGRDCPNCALSGECLAGRAPRRTICRDKYESLHEQTEVRMRLRQFLLRGFDKVRIEWLWACTSFNLCKLVRCTAELRAQIAAATA